MQSLLFGQSLKKKVNPKLPLKKDMTDIGLITRELPVRESTSVMESRLRCSPCCLDKA